MFDLKKYAEALVKEAGLPEDKAKAFLETLQDEKVSKKFAADFIDRPTFSSELDKQLAKGKEEQKKEYQTWYDGVLKTVESNKKVFEETATALAKYRETYGELDADGAAKLVGDYVSKKDLEEMMGKRDAQTIFLIKNAAKYATQHLHQFGEPLDMDALEKLALEKNLTLDQAYATLTAPRVQAKTSAEHEAALKKAREEGLQEGLSRSNVPIDTKPKQPHPFWTARENKDAGKAPDEGTLRTSFVDAFNKAAAPTT